MKKKASVKKRCKNCKVIRRGKNGKRKRVVMVICSGPKTQRHKQSQG